MKYIDLRVRSFDIPSEMEDLYFNHDLMQNIPIMSLIENHTVLKMDYYRNSLK